MNYDANDVPIFRIPAVALRAMVIRKATFATMEWDMSDDRIYALAFFKYPMHEPECPFVGFTDGAAFVVFHYLQVHFMDWAPGWGFVTVGPGVYASDEDGIR